MAMNISSPRNKTGQLDLEVLGRFSNYCCRWFRWIMGVEVFQNDYSSLCDHSHFNEN
jgi:hypothetical protein